MAESKAPTMFIEVYDKRKSGFILDGTAGTSVMEELDCPSISWIPTEGRMCEKDKNGIRHDIKIRFINGCDSILVEEQDKRGFKPNFFEDKIPFDKGYATVTREGSGISLYDYLEKAYYNADNEDRSPTAAKLYKMVRLDKIAEEFNEEDEVMADAIKFVSSLRLKTGKDGYRYNEDRINALCSLLNVMGDTYPQKIYSISLLAKTRSRWFMETVSKFEQTIVIEVSHALELNVIKFDGNAAMYYNENKVIKNLGTQALKKQEKIEQLADFLKTREGNAELTELRVKLNLAKENALKNS